MVTVEDIANRWKDERWKYTRRDYSPDTVLRLMDHIHKIGGDDYHLARHVSEKLWNMLQEEDYVHALGALSGTQARQYVKAGQKAVYVSGWQVAASANADRDTYPDQSIYSVASVPNLCEEINNAFMREGQILALEGIDVDPYAPLVADAEAGFGGIPNAYELMRKMIKRGAAGVHFEDQLSSAKKCGHLGGKVVVPVHEFVKKLKAARLAADVMDVPTVLIARTDANSAKLITNDSDERDHPFIIDRGEFTSDGFYRFTGGLDAAIARGLAYAPYADMIWCETSKPDLDEAKRFAEGIHKDFPHQKLAYNCSPSFNWKKHLDGSTIARFQRELGAMGYAFQFITLAGWHALNEASFRLAHEYGKSGMTAYAELQDREFKLEELGYTATKHQREAGVPVFDEVVVASTGGESDVAAMGESTEQDQF